MLSIWYSQKLCYLVKCPPKTSISFEFSVILILTHYYRSDIGTGISLSTRYSMNFRDDVKQSFNCLLRFMQQCPENQAEMLSEGNLDIIMEMGGLDIVCSVTKGQYCLSLQFST